MSPPYYLRAWHRLGVSIQSYTRVRETFRQITQKLWATKKWDYILVFYNISFSWLLPLDSFQFIFLLRDNENDLYYYSNFRTDVNFSARKALFYGLKKIIFWWLRCEKAVIAYKRRETWCKIKFAVVFDWTYHFPLHPLHPHTWDSDWPYNFVHVRNILLAPLIGYNSVAYKNSRLFSESISASISVSIIMNKVKIKLLMVYIVSIWMHDDN